MPDMVVGTERNNRLATSEQTVSRRQAPPHDHAVDLSHDGITLFRREGQFDWVEISHVSLSIGTLGESLERLAAIARGAAARAEVRVWLPEDQVVRHALPLAEQAYTQEDRDAAGRALAKELSDARGGHAVDPDAGGTPFRPIAASVPIGVLRETQDFLEAHGFHVLMFTTRNVPGGLHHAPRFARLAGAAEKPAAARRVGLGGRIAAVAAAAALVVAGALSAS